jgi:ribosome-associated toxin RatA of RatAB toxin-antitoxin module
MKFVAYILAAVIFFTVLLAPFVELLSAFGDMCKISAAVSASSRAAIMSSEVVESAADAEAKIDFDKFKSIFKDNFCSALNLNEYYRSNDDKYNDFTVKFELLEDDNCKIEVKTEYKFKTDLFNKYLSDLSSDSNKLRVVKTQALEIEN